MFNGVHSSGLMNVIPGFLVGTLSVCLVGSTPGDTPGYLIWNTPGCLVGEHSWMSD